MSAADEVKPDQAVRETRDKDILAAEYVLGTLDADDRANAQMLVAIDPDFAASIVRWERRFGELHVLVDSVDPPPSTWEWIKARIAAVQQNKQVWMPSLEDAAAAATRGPPPDPYAPRLAPAPAAPPAPAPAPPPPAASSMEPLLREELGAATRRVRRWRWATFLVFLLAPIAIGVAVLRDQRPELMPDWLKPTPIIVEKEVEVIREVIREVPSQQMAEYVAVFRNGSEPGIAFLLTLDTERRMAAVRRVDAPLPLTGTHELWIVTEPGAEPRSMGVLDGDPISVNQAFGDYDIVTLKNAVFGISREAYGGSRDGRPSGPMIESRLIQASPAGYPSSTP